MIVLVEKVVYGLMVVLVVEVLEEFMEEVVGQLVELMVVVKELGVVGKVLAVKVSVVVAVFILVV